MTDLIWVTKRTGLGDADVTISAVKNNHNKSGKAINFRFRNNSYLRITKNDFVEFAVTPARIYFRESNKTNGFKLTAKTEDKKGASLKTTFDDLIKYCGDYELEFDTDLHLNYISLTQKEDK